MFDTQDVCRYCDSLSAEDARLRVIPQVSSGHLYGISVNFDPNLYRFDYMEFADVLRDVPRETARGVTAALVDPSVIENGNVHLYVNDVASRVSTKCVKRGIDLVVQFLRTHQVNGGASA